MRFVVTGEWSRNRLLQVIIVLYSLYVAALWVTNTMLYFNKMTLEPSSVVAYYLGDEATYQPAKTYQGLLEVSHFHLFAMGMLLMVLTHLMLFVPIRSSLKAWLIALPFFAAALDEAGGWLVRFGSPEFAIVKVVGFLLLQASLAALIIVSLWSVATEAQSENYTGFVDDEDDSD
ncbi:MAG: hypothetical protein VX246_03810 [Myxococcota bacterium]|nr:hypothetical protein [Myxococcota bacterium]